MIGLSGFSYGYPGQYRFTLREISWQIAPGECHCLLGPTGSGKSTLALALKGLLPPGRQAGSVLGTESIRVGLVLQNPETQLLCDTVGSEVAFGLENRAVPSDQMPARVAEALARVGLDVAMDRDVRELSMGQKYRLLVASALVLQPGLLILDEPSSQLDPQGLADLLAILLSLKADGVALLLCEHDPRPLAVAIDAYWKLSGDGALLPAEAFRLEAPESSRPVRSSGPILALPGRQILDSPAISARDLTVGFADAPPLLDGVSFEVARGSQLVLCGHNGAGKSTLLRCLAGMAKPRSGEIRLLGEPPDPGRLRGRLGCLLQNPERQLFEDTVFEELAFPLRRSGLAEPAIKARIEQVLEGCCLEGYEDRSPHLLSFGEKHLVALAAVLAPQPELLLLDDPFAGLDHRTATAIRDIIARENAERGITIVLATHDSDRTPDFGAEALVLQHGRTAA